MRRPVTTRSRRSSLRMTQWKSEICMWEGCYKSMRGRLSIPNVRTHLKDEHNLDTSSALRIKCGWAGCDAEVLASGMAKHVAITHLGTARYPCSGCGNIFLRKDSQKRHWLTSCKMYTAWYVLVSVVILYCSKPCDRLDRGLSTHLQISQAHIDLGSFSVASGLSPVLKISPGHPTMPHIYPSQLPFTDCFMCQICGL